MSTILELCRERANLVHQARALLDRADEEKRELTAEENEQYDRLLTEASKKQQEVDRRERLDAAERALDEPLNTRVPSGDVEEPEGTEAAQERAAAFRSALLRGPVNLSPDQRRALQMDLDEYGGYLVTPTEWNSQLIKAVDNMVFMRGLSYVQTVTSAESLGVVSLDNDPADPTWTSELDIGDEDSTMSFGKRELAPHPLAKYIKISNKLLRASTMGVEALVRERLAYKFGTTMEYAYLRGTGANQPLGVMTASDDGISTSRDVSEDMDTDAPTADGLLNCIYALKPQYRTRASWIFHTDTIKEIAKLKDGQGQYIWHLGLRGGQPDTILQRPVYESQYMLNTLSTGEYIGILGDFQFYWIVDALTMTIQVLKELYAATNQTGYIARAESDGMPVLEEAFVRVKLG